MFVSAPCIAIAACAFDAAAAIHAQSAQGATDGQPGRVLLQLTPAQDFRPSDGRPMDVPAWRINAAIAQRVIAAFSAAQPPVIDYEHQTLRSEANGQPAPAAGWIHGLRWIEGRGLFAEAELTARARELIAGGEYRYFSPVLEYASKTGEVRRILMGALTNNPAIHGMQAIDLMAAATSKWMAAPNTPTLDEESTTMTLLQKLLAALGLPESTSEDAALAACAAQRAQAEAARAALSLGVDASAESVTAACTSLSAQATAAAQPDPAKFVPIAAVQELQASVAALTARQREREVDDLVAPALADGRLLPAQEAWARDLGKSNLAALSSYLQTAQPIAALSGTQTQGQPPAGAAPGTGGLSREELAVAAACGLTPEVFASGKQ
ncbi:MAG: phage protease [Comamonadaceae bacterium]|nr:phage protease [Comamonadaceae bacterium]